MSDINLAELIALLQDNIQRSYEYVEDIVEIGREGPDHAVTMAVDKLNIEIPVSCSLVESEVDISGIEKKAVSGSPFEISALRLQTPSMSAAMSKSLRAKAIAKHVQSFEARHVRQADNPPKVKLSKRTNARVKPGATVKKATKKKTIKAKDFRLSILNAENLVASKAIDVGRLTISFKATLK